MTTSALAAPTLVEALPDGVVVADGDGRIVYANPAIRWLLGYEPEALHGQPMTVLFPERLRTRYAEGYRRLLTSAVDRPLGRTSQVPARRSDGSELTVEVTLSRLDESDDPDSLGDGRGVLVGVLRDVTASVRLARQLEVGRYLNATLRVTTALTEAPDADVAFDRLLPSLCTELDWDAATLWQPVGSGARLARRGTWSAPGQVVPALQADSRDRTFVRGQGLPGLAWARREPVVVEDLWHDGRFLRPEIARDDDLRTAVAFPVLRGEKLLAVCELFSRRQRPVPTELLDVLASAGRQIGQFLARLQAETELRELADTLQRNLLPAHLPAIPGVTLAASYRAGAEGVFVGGDTYDVLPLPDGRWMVLIADVCGTGVEAAAMTAITRHTARAAAATNGPAGVLAAVNRALLHEQADAPLRFVTACCVVLHPDPAGTTAQLAVAGHPQPLLMAPRGAVTEVGVTGPPLGVIRDVECAEVELQLPEGTTLVLYTDGVTEARNDQGTQFGEAGLLHVLQQTAGGSAEATVEAVSQAVERQLSGSRYGADDQAVLAVSC
jgi:sigma-B regulation protein RsbU (phosphoserine phosphatase)